MKTKLKRSQSSRTHTLFLLYELGQVAELECFWHEMPEDRAHSLVIAFSLDIEAKLTERGIAFHSARQYRHLFPDLLAKEDEMMAVFFSDPRWSRFTYRGVSLPITFQFMFRAYLQRVWYYSNLIISIVEAHPRTKRLVLFVPSGIVSEVAGGLAGREIAAVVDSAKTIATIKDLSIKIIPLPLSRASLRTSREIFFFNVQRALFGFLLMIWNAVITLIRRPRHPRLVISDHWRNIGPAIELLKEGECIFLDRMEIRHIPWRTLLRYRMRFVHSENFLSRDMCRRARERARELAREWQNMRADMVPVFDCRGYSLDPLLVRAMDDIVLRFEKTLCAIEGTYALYDRFRPEVVLLRASVSGQTHFSILPLTAKATHIPSLELQHGLEYLGQGSSSREHAAEYIAAYGPLVRKELLSIGYAPEKVREIGSPRFDKLRLGGIVGGDKHPPHPFTVLCIAPDIRPFEIYDSYSAEEYFSAVAEAAGALTHTQMIIKFRPGSSSDDPLRAIAAKAFARVPYTAEAARPLSGLFARADMVVSCYSTVVLETLQCGMPVVIPVMNPVDAAVTQFHFSRYHDAGAVRIVSGGKELAASLAELEANPALRSEMGERAREFIDRNFSFDGRSSSRCADLIIELAGRSTSSGLK